MSKEPGKVNLTEDQIKELQDKIESGKLDGKDKELLINALKAMVWLSKMLEAKKLSLRKLTRLFGWKTEKSKKDDDTRKPPGPKSGGGKPRGKGRRGKDEYTGAKRVFHEHPNLKNGDRCQSCLRGNLYNIDPGSFIQIEGATPLIATVHEMEKLRCSGCGEIFTAPLPKEIRKKKWDETADAMIGLMKYGVGTPFYRLGKLQGSLGIPLPASTQWDRVETLANSLYPVYLSLIEEAAKGKVSFIDDTKNKILSFVPDGERKGIFTTGLVSKLNEQEIVLYFTGNKHAGENLEQVLSHRPHELPLMIQMSDALSRNIPKSETEVGFCHVHARRNFIDAEKDRIKEVNFVLHLYSKIFKLEKEMKEKGLDDIVRLKQHQKVSGKILKRLRHWCLKCFYLKKVDPAEGLGQAIQYLLNHWERLTLFLRLPGVPLENNTAERTLKTRILERKNSYFYKTEIGAKVGDIISSLIQTATKSNVNVFDYLCHLHRNKDQVRKDPKVFLPWALKGNLA